MIFHKILKFQFLNDRMYNLILGVFRETTLWSLVVERNKHERHTNHLGTDYSPARHFIYLMSARIGKIEKGILLGLQ